MTEGAYEMDVKDGYIDFRIMTNTIYIFNPPWIDPKSGRRHDKLSFVEFIEKRESGKDFEVVFSEDGDELSRWPLEFWNNEIAQHVTEVVFPARATAPPIGTKKRYWMYSGPTKWHENCLEQFLGCHIEKPDNPFLGDHIDEIKESEFMYMMARPSDAIDFSVPQEGDHFYVGGYFCNGNLGKKTAFSGIDTSYLQGRRWISKFGKLKQEYIEYLATEGLAYPPEPAVPATPEFNRDISWTNGKESKKVSALERYGTIPEAVQFTIMPTPDDEFKKFTDPLFGRIVKVGRISNNPSSVGLITLEPCPPDVEIMEQPEPEAPPAPPSTAEQLYIARAARMKEFVDGLAETMKRLGPKIAAFEEMVIMDTLREKKRAQPETKPPTMMELDEAEQLIKIQKHKEMAGRLGVTRQHFIIAGEFTPDQARSIIDDMISQGYSLYCDQQIEANPNPGAPTCALKRWTFRGVKLPDPEPQAIMAQIRERVAALEGRAPAKIRRTDRECLGFFTLAKTSEQVEELLECAIGQYTEHACPNCGERVVLPKVNFSIAPAGLRAKCIHCGELHSLSCLSFTLTEETMERNKENAESRKDTSPE